MAFLLLTTGQVLEVGETRAAIRAAIAAAGPAITVTVGAGQMDVRDVGIIAIAENREQLRIVPSWWT